MVPTAYMLQWKQFTNGVVAANPNMQVFEILVNAMTTYKPLLKRIKRQYDRALEDAMKSSFENIHLKSEFAAAESNLSKAVDDALNLESAGVEDILDETKDTKEILHTKSKH